MAQRIPEITEATGKADRLALTIAQAVQASGLSRSFLYRKFDTGELPRLKAGKRVLILRADLENYLNTLRQP